MLVAPETEVARPLGTEGKDCVNCRKELVSSRLGLQLAGNQKYGWQVATQAQGVGDSHFALSARGHSDISFPAMAQAAFHPGNAKKQATLVVPMGYSPPGKVPLRTSESTCRFPAQAGSW